MAKVRNNIVTQGLSGKLGNTIVFRQVGEETIVTTVPRKSNIPPSELQKKQHRRFQQAVIYAHHALQDEAIKESYQRKAKGKRRAFNVAVADYMNAPDIEEIDVSGYDGTKGSGLIIKAVDDHMVSGVHVSIYKNDGTLVEQGEAVLHENGLDWVYIAQKTIPSPNGSKVVISATDMPGNTVEKEQGIA